MALSLTHSTDGYSETAATRLSPVAGKLTPNVRSTKVSVEWARDDGVRALLGMRMPPLMTSVRGHQIAVSVRRATHP